MAGFENNSLNDTGAASSNGTDGATSGMDSPTPIITAAAFVLLISILGMIGNSLVFWYLGFRIKRTKYTIYIINLAVADLIYLTFISIVMCITFVLYLKANSIENAFNIVYGLEIILDFGKYADMFFLTAISVERCMSVYCPIWYRNNRPKNQSVFVCVIIWGLSVLVTLVNNVGCPSEIFHEISGRCTSVLVFIAVLVFLVVIPLMIISSLILLITIRRTSRQVQPSKIIIVIVASVVVFLISVAPVTLLWLLLYLDAYPSSFSIEGFFFAVYLCISINSSVNPFIYFLVGRHNMKGVCAYLERALKKVFREDDDEEESGPAKVQMDQETRDSNIS
ncbi:proto-oncogene Mas-like [Ambystoma mexicanum]|uniref:proto-oncogene Mas-like n=1 Tax=Ambystoma mexicanum TaxID=8296 RepID=UPI0037E87DA5